MHQPPLRELTKYWRHADERQGTVNGLFERAAEHYDYACNLMSLGSGQSYRRDALVRAGIRQGMHVLDIGTGTGLLAREIAAIIGPSGRVIGLDPAFNMLAAGRRLLDVRFVQGVGERLPFPDGRFDVVTMGYALRHVSDLDEAFAEYRRVLKPDGRVLLLEITKPISSGSLALARLYFGSVVPWMTRIATRSADAARLMRFYWSTIEACVPPETVMASLRRSGFQQVQRGVVMGLFSEYGARCAFASDPTPSSK
jgi:demethylmenaquinone methyltransferase/2-methoxy-6-polyprenyl-1,4-benzoquinol methylase